MSTIVSIAGMIVILASSFALDRWIWDLKNLGHSTLQLAPTLWGTALAMLTAVSMLLALAWYVAGRRRWNRLVGIVFMALGLAILAFPPLAYSEPSPALAWMKEPALRSIKIALLQSGVISLFQLTSAAVAIIGIIALLSSLGKRTTLSASA